MSVKDWGIDRTWTLFLDRDGVINERIWGDYIKSLDEFEFRKDAPEALAGLSRFFHLIVVVTNQQGIGKGLMSERNLLEIHNYMCDHVFKTGGKIDKCFFAPNLKGAEDDIRKPSPEMAYMAKAEYPQIDFSRSVMVGDADTDIQFGKNLGMKTVRILTEVEPVNIEADLAVNSLIEFLNILRHEA